MAAQTHKQPNLEEVEAFLKNVQVQILEQPAENKHRFRYKSEGRATGTLLGESSSDEIKTYPKLKVIGYQVKQNSPPLSRINVAIRLLISGSYLCLWYTLLSQHQFTKGTTFRAVFS